MIEAASAPRSISPVFNPPCITSPIKAACRSWTSGRVHLLQQINRHARVQLRGGELGVAEQLNHPDVGAVLQHLADAGASRVHGVFGKILGLRRFPEPFKTRGVRTASHTRMVKLSGQKSYRC